jgi:DNA-binding SARP family transcriptional activator
MRTNHLFATELGIDPGEELTRLRDRILRDDPSLALATATTA